MNYIKIIETTSNWTPPKSSTYLVICVGGGGGGKNDNGSLYSGLAGQVTVGTAELLSGSVVSCTVGNGGSVGNNGESSHFGAYLSASGGSRRYDTLSGGGEGGYTLDGIYGGNGGYRVSGNIGTPTKNGGASNKSGNGYGAGGSSSSAGLKGAIIIKDIGEGYMKCLTSGTSWVSPKSAVYRIVCVGGGGGGAASPLGFGKAGAMKVSTLSLAEGESVPCTVGSGGSMGLSGGSTSFGAYLSASGGESVSSTFTGGEGGYTLDGIYGGVGGDYISSSNVTLASSPTKNGGRYSFAGNGYGAGGSYGEENGKGGIIVITEVA